MPSYKVRLPIRKGETKKEGDLETVEHKLYVAGDSIELTEDEAYASRHALEEPPLRPTKKPGATASGKAPRSDSGDDLEKLTEEEEEALDSIRKRPDNPDSGVFLHWQAQSGTAAPPARTREVGHGFERANVGLTPGFEGLAGPYSPRPESNKTEMELEDEEAVKKSEDASQKKAAVAGAMPTRPLAVTPASTPPPVKK